MRRVDIFFVLLAALIMASCGSPEETDCELQGQRWVSKARNSLVDADYTLARIYIDSLRTRCKMALNAREDAILLLDSIDLAEAREQLHRAEFMASQEGLNYMARDSVNTNLDRAQAKVLFFEKKLEYDKANKKRH